MQEQREWRPYIMPYGYQSGQTAPYHCDQIWIYRREWAEPLLVDPSKLSGTMNMDGLYWQPARAEEPAPDLPWTTPTDLVTSDRLTRSRSGPMAVVIAVAAVVVWWMGWVPEG